MASDSPNMVLQRWQERDLTQAALEGELPPAFHVDDAVAQVLSVLEEGRSPVLVGPSGVGKTAIIQEVVRRALDGRGPSALREHHVVQLSIRRFAASLEERNLVGPAMQELVAALSELEPSVVPYFRDFDAAHAFWLMPQLELLAHRLSIPVLAEGSRGTVEAMFEDYPELHQQYVPLVIEEPSFERARVILGDWGADHAERRGRTFTPRAQYEALQLAYRFLTRGHLPRSALELLRQTGSSAGEPVITEAHVFERFCASHNVPRKLIDPALSLDLAQVERDFRSGVHGQPEAVESVVQIVGLIKAGLASTARPLGVLLFAGPTGVGKTHVARVLASYLFGNEDRMIRINMADYQRPDAVELLFGNPYAHNAALVRGSLTTRLSGRPFGVLLLDEFEKANPAVQDAFLQLFDEGVFINGAHETVSCRSLVLIATTNAGAEAFRSSAIGFDMEGDIEARRTALDQALRTRYRPELLNRFDRVVHFGPLGRAAIRAVALGELERMRQRPGILQRGLDVHIDLSVVDWLVVNGFDPHWGARFLKRTLERHVTTALASAIVRAEAGRDTHFEVTVRGNRVVARPLSQGRPERTARTAVERPLGTGTERVALSAADLAAHLDALASATQPLLARLEAAGTERSALLARVNASGFWDSPTPTREQVLDRYRELDVVVETETRLARPIAAALELRGQSAEGDLSAAARRLERALEAVREWDERLAEAGPSEAWLLISAVDALHPPSAWLERLALLEHRWCERLGLRVQIAGYAGLDGLTCAGLHVEGAGAANLLTMEHGIHRRHGPESARDKARVEVVAAARLEDEMLPPIADLKRRQGLFDLALQVRGRLDIEPVGVAVELFGADPLLLGELLNTLGRAWRDGVPSLEVARDYAVDGLGARDARTGAVVARTKDVDEGRLDALLEAWRAHIRAGG